MPLFSYIAYALIALILLAFILVAYRDVALLFFPRRGGGARGIGILPINHPAAPSLRPGLPRVWAVARIAIAESLHAKIYVLPLLWLAACLLINAVVTPYDEQERIGLYLRVLLTGQQFLTMIFLAVLACFSLPRERDRRTIITTGSKPLSRLELFLGKITGFATIALAMLLIMGAITYAYLLVADRYARATIAAVYAKQNLDYEADNKNNPPPSEGLRQLSETGLLAAQNFITPAAMQIAGHIAYDPPNPPIRFLQGGSEERVLFRFPSLRRVYGLPYLPYFHFEFLPVSMRAGPQPQSIQIQITVYRQNSPGSSATEEATITLEPDPNVRSDPRYFTNWRPDDPSQLFGMEFPGDPDHTIDVGPINIKLACPTKGVYLQILDLRNRNDTNIMADMVAIPGGAGPQEPLAPPEIIGFEKHDLQQITGPDVRDPGGRPEVANFRFPARDLQNIPIDHQPDPKDDTFTVSLYLDIEKENNQTRDCVATVTAYNLLAAKPVTVSFNVQEKRANEIKLPASLLERDSTSNRVVADLYLDLRCHIPGHWIGVNTDSVRIEQPPSWFLTNLFKSELIIFLEVLLIVLIAVAASVRLGGAVALLLTAWSFLMGLAFSFVQQQLTSSDSIFSPGDQRQLAGNWLYQSLNIAQGASLKVVELFLYMLPDFTKFQPLDHIIASRNMPWSVVGIDAIWILIYALPFIALGYLLIRKQELS